MSRSALKRAAEPLQKAVDRLQRWSRGQAARYRIGQQINEQHDFGARGLKIGQRSARAINWGDAWLTVARLLTLMLIYAILYIITSSREIFPDFLPMMILTMIVVSLHAVAWTLALRRRAWSPQRPTLARLVILPTHWLVDFAGDQAMVSWDRLHSIEPHGDEEWLLLFDGGRHRVRFRATEAEATQLQALIASFQERWSQHGEVSNAALSSARLTGDEAAERGVSRVERRP